MSPRYVAVRLSFSEILLSTRIVKKFSLMTCWPAKVKIPMSPFVPDLVPPLGTCQKGRYFWAEGSTVIVFGEQAGVVSGAEHRVPARAAADGTVFTVVMPFDW